jgi:tetratricopeptide (TPR) repeat protein
MAANEKLKPEGAQAKGPELRLLDRRAFVGFPSLEVEPGLVISDFALQIQDATFPFSLTGGPSRYQKKKLGFGLLEVSLDAELLRRHVAKLAAELTELEDLKLQFRPGYLEGQARLKAGEKTPLTFKVAFDGEGERLQVYFYDVRLYGFSPTPAVAVPLLLTRALLELDLLPDAEPLGAVGLSSRVLVPLCQWAAVGRGYRMPALDGARLSGVEVSAQGLRLRFSAGGLPPPTSPDEELLLTLEGLRAFQDDEALIARGKLAEAREAYLKRAQDAHPFAAERLLGLLVADPGAHELALDLAETLAQRREKSPTALWVEAVVRERRGEHARAAERYLALCALARKAQEETAAFFAAEAAARASREHAPQVAVKALHEVLGLRPDHLPSLLALARAADGAQDRAGAIRAYRRITALARDPMDAAEAHVQLARLCALTEDDLAGARLHCEAALRLAPDHPEALYQLGVLCHRAGEPLRALKALDRLKDVAQARHELDRVGRAQLLAGQVWEEGLHQLDNALLRYKEALTLLPGEPEPAYHVAHVAEALGRLQEAVTGYQQSVELSGPHPRAAEARRAAHLSHKALARLYRSRLHDAVLAREHLEAAFRLDPTDKEALDELLPTLRQAGRYKDLAEALEKAAALAPTPEGKAVHLSEAGELYRTRLAQPDKAEKLLAQALESDGHNRAALEGALALAEARRDGGALCRALKALAELSVDPKERVGFSRRLWVAARDVAFDLDLAVHALEQVLKAEPEDLSVLGELCALQRKRSDMEGLSTALDRRARVAEHQRDLRLAAATLREHAQVLEVRLGRPGEAVVALEKAARLAPEPNVLLELGDLSLRCERPEHARKALEDVLGLLPRHASPERVAEVHARLGKACDLMGDKEGAAEHYAKALPLRRLDDELAGRLEALYQELGRTADLSELWTTRAQALLAADRPEAAAPLLLKSARHLLDAGQREAAVHKLSSALELSPRGPHAVETVDLLAGLELQRGNRLEAAKLLARQASLLEDPRAASRILFRAATLAQGTAREEGFLGEALRFDPGFLPARVRRAELLLAQAPERALEDLERVLDSPEAGQEAPTPEERLLLHRRAADAAQKLNRPEPARRHLMAYVERRPDDVDAMRELAKLHRAVGADEALLELDALLIPRLSGEEAVLALREQAELFQKLGQASMAVGPLRELVARDAEDNASAEALLRLLNQGAAVPRDGEVLDILGRLVRLGSPERQAEAYVQRARVHREAGRLSEAQADLMAAAQRASSAPLWLEAAELARTRRDDAGELSAWMSAVKADRSLVGAAAPRLLSLAQARLEARDAALAQKGFLELAQLDLDAEPRSRAYFGLAKARDLLGDAHGALEALGPASAAGEPERRVEALLWRAELAEKLSRPQVAKESLRAVLALSPRHPEATKALVRVLTQAEDFQGLASLLQEVAEHAPTDEAARLHAELGSLYLGPLKQPERAEVHLRQAAALDGRAVQVHRALFNLLVDRSAWPDAGTAMEVAARELSAPEAAALLREGAVRVEAKDAALALALVRRAHGLVPAQGEELFHLAEVLYRRGSAEEALPVLTEAAQTLRFADAPERAESLLLALADLLERRRELSAAQRIYRRVLEERPRSVPAAERLAALLSKDEPRAALELLAQVAGQAEPSDAVGHKLLALGDKARDELADTELAARLFTQAAGMLDAPLAARERLVSLWRSAGRSSELMAALRAVAALCNRPEDLGRARAAYEEEANVAESMGRLEDALHALTRAGELCLTQGQKVLAAEHERRKAELYRDAVGDFERAQKTLERAFELYPELTTARMGVALAQRQKDVRAEARWLERETERGDSPLERARAKLRLSALTLEALKDTVRGEALLREVVNGGPPLPEAQALLAKLLADQGRVAELGALYEELAARATDKAERLRLYQQAGATYRDEAKDPGAAAAAFLAARAISPEDLSLTAQAADALFDADRPLEAAELDAVLLHENPFREPSARRHLAHLSENGEEGARAELMFARAGRQSGEEAAQSYLEAALAFRAAGAEERARLCEGQAFEQAPELDAAFEAARAQAQGETRRLAEVLARRARAVPRGAGPLLTERARMLTQTGDALNAAEAWDELLGVEPDSREGLLARGELAFQGGGARAAQPYDRRLLRAVPDLDKPLVVKLQLRLGHASFASGAYQDAADALEEVVALDGTGERGHEALSLLAEVHQKTGNVRGLFDTSVKLAREAKPEEAETLYRRAADLFDAPQDAVDALLPLARLRPSDTRVVERAVEALKSLGRASDEVDVLERGAEAVGGPRAARLLFEAARVSDEALHDGERALGLIERARTLDPNNLDVLKRLLGQYRARKDGPALRAALTQLLATHAPSDEAALWRLELAEVCLAQGDSAQAKEALQAVWERGPEGQGYAQALERLLPLLDGDPDAGLRADALAAQAELVSGGARAELLVKAAAAARDAQELSKAARLCRVALAERASLDGYLLMAEVAGAQGDFPRQAAALRQAAGLSEGRARPERLLAAVDAWEAAQDLVEARELLELVAREHPDFMPPAALAGRLGKLGEAARALEVGFVPLMERGAYAEALALADAASDRPRSQEALWKRVQVEKDAASRERLTRELVAHGSEDEKERLAGLAQEQGAPELARGLYESILASGVPGPDGVGRWRPVAERLMALGERKPVVLGLAGRLASKAPAEWVAYVTGLLLELSGPDVEAALRQVADELPTERARLLRALVDRTRGDRRFGAAAELYEELIASAAEPGARVALQLELGALYLKELADPVRARASFEGALKDAPESTLALRHLLELTRGVDLARYVAVAERLMAQDAGVRDAEHGTLVDAYESLGRVDAALALVAELPETPERLERREQLNAKLGRVEEALGLRERRAQTVGEREAVVDAYLDASLWTPAARLLQALLDGGQLSPQSQRRFAERLAEQKELSGLGVLLWRRLLGAATAEVPLWRGYAEALALAGREDASAQAHGVVRALTGDRAPASGLSLSPVERGTLTVKDGVPPGSVEVTSENMPKLEVFLRTALKGLGARVKVYLHSTGGAEAYLASADELVLGAGALGRFGPVELTYLLALAFTLGDAGRKLTGYAAVAEMPSAAARAFAAVPSPLAAGRVLGWLDDAVRGTDAGPEVATQALATSAAFRAVCLKMLE